jgi:hypothetical protein
MTRPVKEWRTAQVLLHCGFDWDHRIPPGDPYLAIAYDATHALIRCRACVQKYFPNDPLPPIGVEEQAS